MIKSLGVQKFGTTLDSKKYIVYKKIRQFLTSCLKFPLMNYFSSEIISAKMGGIMTNTVEKCQFFISWVNSARVIKNLDKIALWIIVLYLGTLCAGCAYFDPAFHAANLRSTLDPDEQAALNQAESLNFAGGCISNQVNLISEPCVVFPKSKLTLIKIDGRSVSESGLPGKNIAFFSPGKHTFSVLYDMGVSVGSTVVSSSGPVSGSIGYSSKVSMPPIDGEYSFEKGKNYTMDFIASWSGPGEFVFTEITDPNELAKVSSYVREYAEVMEKRIADAKANQKNLDPYLSFSKKNRNLLEGKWIQVQVAEGDWIPIVKGFMELEFSGNKIICT
ncbi:MAG: hypothetical protein LBP22_17410 [Deltaproteobacteria bacterium]|jgi:hypothetical protein|nr:hypothetical protein [Deltaproteobacteria bacterium]